MSVANIRELRQDDDYSRISELIYQSISRFRDVKKVRCAPNPDYLRGDYFGEDGTDPLRQGYVAVKNGLIVAFAGVHLAEPSNNGLLSVGFENGYEEDMSRLLDLCAETVRDSGGQRISRFVSLKPGHIRNEEISFWERYGFRADPFFQALIKLEVDEWTPPASLDTSFVQPIGPTEWSEIVRILDEDEEDVLADEIRQTNGRLSPDHVFLTMKDETTGEISAIAYYQISRFKDKRKDGKVYDGLGAWETGVHFRPRHRLSRQQKRRFIRAVLSSMKQLNVIFASGRASSRDFDGFVELFAEGFDFQGSPEVQNRMCRQV